MKLIGLYEFKDLKNVEENHLQFCLNSGLEYQKVYIQNYDEKWKNVYAILDENPEGEFLFIDSYSFFKTDKFNFSFQNDIHFERTNQKVLDNFFFIRSTDATRKLFFSIIIKSYESIINNKLFYNPLEINQVIPVNYPSVIDDYYFNLNCLYHNNYHLVNKIIVLHHKNYDRHNLPLSNIICVENISLYANKPEKIEIINPNQQRAIVSLYTDETKEYGKISEDNISKWCLDNQTTYYIYRKLPEELNKISVNWSKPNLILNHINSHEFISWMDSDIIILGNITLPYDNEVTVFSDPACWFFNSGFMTFKNTEKNVTLLKSIIEKMETLDKSSVYANGGDQSVFNDEIKKYYPDILPKNNLTINSFLNYHFFKKPEEINAMVHFMGYHPEVRRHLMDYYNKISKTIPR